MRLVDWVMLGLFALAMTLVVMSLFGVFDRG